MDVKTIIEQANLHKGAVIINLYAFRWINEAMEKLASLYDTARVEKSTTIISNDTDKYYSLPDGCIGVKRVSNKDYPRYTDFIADVGVIKFSDKGDFTVIYQTSAPGVVKIEDIPGINSAYHMAIAKYVASSELTDVKPQKANMLMGEFYRDAGDVDTMLRRQKRKGARIPVYNYR